MTQMSLGLPLMGAAAGTLLSLALPSKRGHIVCGMAWAGLSALHAWQYRKKLAQDIKKNGRFLVMTNFPQSKLDFFIRAVEIASYIPGRARLYARPLVGNEALAAQIAVIGEKGTESCDANVRVLQALSGVGMPISTINQGAGKLNLLIGVPEDRYEDAIRAIYGTIDDVAEG